MSGSEKLNEILFNALKELSLEEKKQILQDLMLEDTSNEVPQEEQSKPKRKKRRKPNKKNNLKKQQPPQERMVQKPTSEKKDESIPSLVRKGKRRRATKPKQQWPSKGTAARVEPINTDTPRPNIFLNSAFQSRWDSTDRKEHNKDKEIDQKLSMNRTPTPRMRESTIVEIDCMDCGGIFEVSTIYIQQDPDTKEWFYRCNQCEVDRER